METGSTITKKKSSVIVQGTILAFASIIVRMIGLLYRIPLTRIIGDEAVGLYSMAFELYNIALLLSSYSLPLAVSKLVSAREHRGEYRNSGKVFRVALAFGFVVGGLATLLVYFGADAYAAFNSEPNLAIPIRVLAPTIFVFSLMGVIRGYFQGHSNMVPTAVSQIIEQVVNAAVSIGAAVYMVKRYAGSDKLSGYAAAGGTYGTFFGALAAAVTLFIIYLVNRPLIRSFYRLDDGSAKESTGHVLHAVILTVIPVVLSQTVYQISGILDQNIWNLCMSLKGTYYDDIKSTWYGIYSGKYKVLYNVPIAVASALGTAIVPNIVGDYNNGNLDKVRRDVSSSIKFNMIIAFPCAFGLAFLGGPIMQLVFGDYSELSAEVMNFGGIAVVFFALSTMTNGVLQGINRMRIPVIHSAIALVLHLILLVVLLRFTDLNLMALVIANIFFALVVCILNWRSVSRLLGYKQEINATFLIPAVSAVNMGIVSALFQKDLAKWIDGRIATVLSVILAVMIYFVLLIRLKGITRDELFDMPKGRTLYRIFVKLKLMK